MKYTELEVLDIIKSSTDKDPKEVFTTWVNRKANTPLDLTKYQYGHFVYTFPIKVEGKEVADVTLVSLYGSSQSLTPSFVIDFMLTSCRIK
jgi:ribosomal protein S7